jgi:hypothetical protein
VVHTEGSAALGYFAGGFGIHLQTITVHSVVEKILSPGDSLYPSGYRAANSLLLSGPQGWFHCTWVFCWGIKNYLQTIPIYSVVERILKPGDPLYS